MRTKSYGSSRVSSDVQRSLSRIISELKDPRVGMMTSVTRCEVTKDLKECKAYISVLGDIDETIRGLNSAKGYIRKSLAASLNLRNTPEITFVADQSIAYGVEMSRRIDEVLHPDKDKAGDADPTTDNTEISEEEDISDTE